MKDTEGFVSEVSQSLTVTDSTYTGVLPDEGDAFEFGFTTTDAVVDKVRNRLYVVDAPAKRLYYINLSSGAVERHF